MVGYLSKRFTRTEAVDACLPCGVKIIQALNNARLANFCRQILIAYYVVCVKHYLITYRIITQIQPYAVDHLARESMKSAANCVN